MSATLQATLLELAAAVERVERSPVTQPASMAFAEQRVKLLDDLAEGLKDAAQRIEFLENLAIEGSKARDRLRDREDRLERAIEQACREIKQRVWQSDSDGEVAGDVRANLRVALLAREDLT